MILQLLFQIIFLSWPMISRTQAQASVKPGCPSKCGNVTIPFPFGIREGCYIDDWFAIDCDSSNKPFIKRIQYLEVLEIFLNGTMRVNHPVLSTCSDENDYFTLPHGNLHAESPFVFSQKSNRFTALGCNNIAYMRVSEFSIVGGCFSICDKKTKTGENGCYGINCCQTKIPSSLKVFNTTISTFNDERNRKNITECRYAFLVDQNWFEKNPQNVEKRTHVPVVLDWGILNSSFNLFATQKQKGYNSTSSCQIYANITSSIANSSSTQFPVVHCNCRKGYEGNPYLLKGCQGFGTGLGSVFLLLGAWWLCIIIKKRKDSKLKQKFFKQNGGLLLQQHLTSSDGSVDSSKLFNSKELEKATDHFNVNRILGEGGQGTVYKGMLSDGRIVAVKKFKVVDERKVHEFVNEVAILSQINHRNVVKLLGCCLETEVPLLVYEFIPNGTLFQYLYHQNEELSLTWGMRLRIAVEVEGAVSYLHSAASLPIYHRDIKSTNILLDEKFKAKVADFGTSKSISIDQTHVTTKVQGTFGYLDPEFFQSGQFTDKSDVYSFRVVLVELLTGQKPTSSMRSKERGSLIAYFITCVEQNCLNNIIDAQVLSQGRKEEIVAVANLAKRCLNLNGKKRPTMKEVSMELEGIQAWQKEVAVELEGVQASQKDDGMQQTYQEIKYDNTEVFEIAGWDVGSSSTSTFERVGSSSVDVQPLLTS
ncbi:wall-associated receptor kinase-like 22 isoform X2 [Pistacia vera]|uniref:wall-associated receptor kinase-like 22 isoform X2 n=1 Tax=Pistacia vera TaxID=55513 RepID=UPI0012639725|nr:wall-associated receptor kinase-like 22 isoform X2 [Pistacia vera]